MKSLERVLVVIDPKEDCSQSPDGLPVELRKALRLSTDPAAIEFKLLSVAYDKFLQHPILGMGYEPEEMRQACINDLQHNLQAYIEALGAQGYRASGEVVWGHPRYEMVIEKAGEYDADLVIQHCRAYAKLEHGHLTNDSWQLVRYCTRPLLLVKDNPWPANQLTLMAAVDPVHSHHKPLGLDYSILDATQVLAEKSAAQFHVVHAYAEAARPFAAAETIRKEHGEAFEALLSDYDIDESQKHFIDETPVYALDEYCQKLQTDIVVMGAVSRSRLQEALIGSTAEKVLDYIKVDVLIVKPGTA